MTYAYKGMEAAQTVAFMHTIKAALYNGSIAKGYIIKLDGADHRIVSIRKIEFKNGVVNVLGKAARV